MPAGRRRFGSVRRLPSGRWQARYMAGNGYEVQAPSTFRTKTDAERWLSAAETDLLRGHRLDTSASQVTLGVYALQWLDQRTDLKITTRKSYEWLLDKFLVPDLGAIPLGRMTPTRVRAWHAHLTGRTGPSVVRQCYALLRAILNTAVRDELMVRNPCTVRGAGVPRSAERPVATIAQVERLAACVPPRYRALVLTAAWSGARWGELAGLTRDRLDLVTGRMRIDRQLVEVRGEGLQPSTPKTAAGVRWVHLPPHLLPELRAHLEQFVPADCEWVFCNGNGQPIRRGSFRSVWWLARDRAGLPGFHFHDLRHTGNTLAAATGASTRELMARMGHASMRAAVLYQHATEERDAAIAQKLSELAAGRDPEAPEAPWTGRLFES